MFLDSYRFNVGKTSQNVEIYMFPLSLPSPPFIRGQGEGASGENFKYLWLEIHRRCKKPYFALQAVFGTEFIIIACF